MEALLIAAVALSNIFCFMIGAKVGQAVVKGEKVDLPNPAKAIREHKQRKNAEQVQNRLDTIMHNIESYDGSSLGQRDVPKG
jgi:hypothetical protein